MELISGEQVLERRKRVRKDEWHRNLVTGAWKTEWARSSNGHLLMIAKSNVGGGMWIKWMNGHSLGMVGTLRLAKSELEALAMPVGIRMEVKI